MRWSRLQSQDFKECQNILEVNQKMKKLKVSTSINCIYFKDLQKCAPVVSSPKAESILHCNDISSCKPKLMLNAYQNDDKA